MDHTLRLSSGATACDIEREETLVSLSARVILEDNRGVIEQLTGDSRLLTQTGARQASDGDYFERL